MSADALQAVLFDLDGTLLDTAPDFAAVLNRMLREHDRAPLPFGQIRATVSHGARALVKLAFGIADGEPGFETLRSRLLELYESGLAIETTPFDGIRELLAALAARGIAWGVVTNKPHYLAWPLLARMALQPPAAVLICPDHVSRTKPDPEPLLLACKQLGCEPGRSIYVGDHARDIEAGRSAGMRTVAAAWGYLAEDESVLPWGADFVAQDVTALTHLLID
jgi:2-phosphoglycolate phosphatase